MMKVSDPIIFGHVIRAFFPDVFARYGADLAAAGLTPNDGLGSIYAGLDALPNGAEIKQAFQDGIDAAVIYVNASTRFTDGFEFGMGAEIGNSTQKLHARGPIGLRELCTEKYLVEGTGQVR